MTSVKVHHAPGGGSSIQLGGGYGGEEAPAAKPAEEQKEGEGEEGDVPAAGGSAVVNDERSGEKLFGSETHTSVKVRAPPGGASSITF